MDILFLNGTNLTLEHLQQVAFQGRQVEIAPEALEKVQKARDILFSMAAEGKAVYGLNRGVGWNKDKEFDQDFFERYNRNLINSHSLGIAPYASVEEVRAMLCIRLNAALSGSTGISVEILKLYQEFLNRGIHPKIPVRGSIGEADITTLSLIGQTMIGQGEVEYKGRYMPAAQALAAEGISPVVLGPKDGLSIVSSNAQGEAMAAELYCKTREFIEMANAVFCLALEGINGGLEPLGKKVNELRNLPGQMAAAAQCREFLRGSYLEMPDPKRALQDPLSYRCASAIHGSTLDALEVVKQYLEIEMNTTDDNPCILLDEGRTSVSQNFETTTLALAVEMVASALNHMSKGICYRLIHIADPALTGLSRFLTPEDVKTIAYGTIQKIFSYLDSENRMLANPSSMDFVPVAGDIEDHASNLPLACTKALKILDNLYYMIGIELIHAAQAVDLRGKPALGKVTEKLYQAFRKEISFLSEDRNLSYDIETAYQFVKDGRLLSAIHR